MVYDTIATSTRGPLTVFEEVPFSLRALRRRAIDDCMNYAQE